MAEACDNLAGAFSSSPKVGSANSLGRKRKMPRDWVRDHPNDLETRKKQVGDKTKEVLTCKYCSVEIDVLSSGKKPWDRVHEHLSTKRHRTIMKKDEKMESNYESEVQHKALQAQAQSLIHDFTRAMIYSGLPLHQADDHIGSVS